MNITIFSKKKFSCIIIYTNNLNPFFEKKIADSDPTNPQDPVIKANLI